MPQSDRIQIEARFEGPPAGGNGGYVGGILAERIGGPAEVTLRAPIPIDTPLQLVRGEAGALRLEDAKQTLAEARPATPGLDLPKAPSPEQARAAGARTRAEHPFPGCFVCGPLRAPGDGLRILTGPLEDGSADATLWTPHDSLAAADGRVDARFLWAALDCPGGMAAMETSKAPMVLGRMTARIDRRPKPGAPCIVVGWELRHEGRKHFTGTALFDASGEPLGCSEQIWIEVAPR